MRFPDKITAGEKYGPAMRITDPEKAREYFEACVEHCMRRTHRERTEAEHIERMNLGYFAGYFNRETYERAQRLYMSSHPAFGSGYPAPRVAMGAGLREGAKKVD